MRMRHKPYAKPELAAWPYSIDEPTALRGHWAGAFAAPLPLRVEMGCGKGGFIAGTALRDAAYNHLGVDIKNEMLVVAKRTIERRFAEAGAPIANVRITAHNIEAIDTVLAPEDSVDRIYVNFCNPWYKSGHAKHRLTHPRQLVKYRRFLKEGGQLFFKTDDDPLFNDSLRYFEMCGFQLDWVTRDLHSAEPAGNVRTEHEEMFSAEGIPIKACIATKMTVPLDEEALLRARDV